MEGLTEEAIEDRSCRTRRVRRADLPQDLAFAGHERVQPGGDAEEMESRVLVAQAVERRSELLLEREQRGFGLFLGAFRRLVREVELRAVAGRETHRLAVLAGKRPGQLGCTLGIESRALPQLDRRLMVRDADEDDAHVAKWVAGKARRTTATRTKPARTR